MDINAVTPYLHVSDVQRSIAFYRDALGFQVTAGMEHDGRPAWARLENGPTSLMVSSLMARSLPHDDDDDHQHGGTWPGPGQVVGVDVLGATWLYVSDVDAQYERLKAAGFAVIGEPRDQTHGTREFMLADPDGYHYVIASPIARP
jgi:lactoylglutathione lyase